MRVTLLTQRQPSLFHPPSLLYSKLYLCHYSHCHPCVPHMRHARLLALAHPPRSMYLQPRRHCSQCSTACASQALRSHCTPPPFLPSHPRPACSPRNRPLSTPASLQTAWRCSSNLNGATSSTAAPVCICTAGGPRKNLLLRLPHGTLFSTFPANLLSNSCTNLYVIERTHVTSARLRDMQATQAVQRCRVGAGQCGHPSFSRCH